MILDETFLKKKKKKSTQSLSWVKSVPVHLSFASCSLGTFRVETIEKIVFKLAVRTGPEWAFVLANVTPAVGGKAQA